MSDDTEAEADPREPAIEPAPSAAPAAAPEPAAGVAAADATDEDVAAFAQEAAQAAALAHLAGEAERETPDEQALSQQGEGGGAAGPAVDSLDGVVPAEISEGPEERETPFDKLQARAARLTDEQVRHVLHALLFVADRPLNSDALRQATGIDGRRIHGALGKLAGELREGVSGVVLSEVAGGWQLRTAPEAAEAVRRLLQVRPRRLTRAALETLAIVAYRQPVTRPEVEEIRGVDSGAVLKALLDWRLVKILGRKDEVGRPILYGTTREFLEFFQLKDLASLPTLREFRELTEESRSIVEEELGPEAVEGISGTVEQLADPGFLAKQAERAAASDAALAELERAMEDTEQKAKVVAASIGPAPAPAAEPAEPPAAPGAQASGPR